MPTSNTWLQKVTMAISGRAEHTPRDIDSFPLRPDTGETSEHFNVVVTRFGANAYNGPKNQDLVKRLKSFMRAASDVALRSGAYSAYKIAELNKLEKEAVSHIQTKLPLDPVKIHAPADGMKKKLLKQYAQQFSAVEEYMKDCVVQASAILLETDDDEAIALMLDEIAETERQLTARAGRPSIMHEVVFPDGTPARTNTKFYSAHQVMGQMTAEQLQRKADWDALTGKSSGAAVSAANPYYTNPSTVRDTEGLPNFLRATFAVDTSTGRRILFDGTRHSSITAIGSFDRIHRHASAFRNAKQLIIQIAKVNFSEIPNDQHIVNADGSISIDVNISSMSLLTNSFLEALRKRDDENKQIKESALALRAWDGEEIDIEIDGQKIKIKVDIHNMTLGCNPARNIPARPFRTDRQKDINYRGFTRNSHSALKHLLRHFNTSANLNASDCTDIQNVLFAINSALQPEQDLSHVDKSKLQAAKQNLKQAYQNLRATAETYETAVIQKKADSQIKQARSAFNQAYQQVQQYESDLDNIYAIYHKSQKAAWQENKHRMADFAAQANNKTFNENNNNIGAILQLYNDLNNLYFKGYYTSSEYYFQFQARYLILNYLLGRTPDFYCKSGEDRTGRINNIIEELMTYYHIDGTFPAYDDKDTRAIIERDISPRIHAESASRETTARNAAGSRGLQVRDTQGSQHLSTTILDKLLAGTAKTIYRVKYRKIKQAFPDRKYIKRDVSSDNRVYSPLQHDQAAADLTDADAAVLINRTHALLASFKPSAASKQFSNYLTMLVTLLDKSDTSLSASLEAEISPAGRTLNPFMERAKRLKALKEKLIKERENIVQRLTLKSDVLLNKRRLAAIDKTLKQLETREFKLLLKQYDAIANRKTTGGDTAVRAAAPKKIGFTQRLPFLARVYRYSDDPNHALGRLQSKSSSLLANDINTQAPHAYNELVDYLRETVTESLGPDMDHAVIEDAITQATTPAAFAQLEQQLKLKSSQNTFVALRDRLSILLVEQHAINNPAAPPATDAGTLLSPEQIRELDQLGFNRINGFLQASTPLPDADIQALQGKINARKIALHQQSQSVKIAARKTEAAYATLVGYLRITAAPAIARYEAATRILIPGINRSAVEAAIAQASTVENLDHIDALLSQQSTVQQAVAAAQGQLQQAEVDFIPLRDSLATFLVAQHALEHPTNPTVPDAGSLLSLAQLRELDGLGFNKISPAPLPLLFRQDFVDLTAQITARRAAILATAPAAGAAPAAGPGSSAAGHRSSLMPGVRGVPPAHPHNDPAAVLVQAVS